MRVLCVADQDVVRYPQYLEAIQQMDVAYFEGCGNEFKANRIWFAAVENDKVLGYAAIAILHEQKLLFFSRAAVQPNARGRGIHKRLIKARLRKAKALTFGGKIKTIITYTVIDNVISANNLIKHGFRLYTPQTKWVGDVIYFSRAI